MFNYNHNYKRYYEQPPRTSSKLSTMNLKDNLPWGDILSLIKLPNTIRLYVQNVNGIKIDATGRELVPICTILDKLNCDIVRFSELKLDVTQYTQ